MKKPNLFLIGGPKCGTTSFQEYLAEHPQIFMSTPKEPCYFDTDIPFPGSPRSESEYMRFFDGVSEQHSFIGEASTNYLYSKVAVPNILKFNPDARFIVMVRNPIDMARSLHSYSVQTLVEDVREFREAWDLQEERRNGRSLPPVNYQRDFVLYGDFCKLGGQLMRLYETVPRERVHTIVFDDLIDDPDGVYRAALMFLGLPHDGRSEFPVRNVTGLPKSRAVHRLAMILLMLRQYIPIKRFGLNVFNKLVDLNRGDGKSPPISVEFRDALANYFRNDVELLSKCMGRDLTAWLRCDINGSLDLGEDAVG